MHLASWNKECVHVVVDVPQMNVMRNQRLFQGMCLVLVISLAFVTTGCQVGRFAKTPVETTTTLPNPNLVLAATSPQLAEFIENIVGERGSVSTILGIHGGDLSPSDITTIAIADITFVSGAGLDRVVTARWPRLEHRGAIVDAGAGIVPLNSSPLGDGQVDPHVWMSPNNVKAMILNITRALSTLDPPGAEYYGANERGFLAQLQQLSDSMKTALALVSGKPFLVTHDGLGYLAKQYGLTVVGSVLPGYGRSYNYAAMEEHRAKLLKDPEVAKARAILVVDGSGLREAAEVSQALSIPLLGVDQAVLAQEQPDKNPLDPAMQLFVDQSVPRTEDTSSAYVATMRHNRDVLVRALRTA